MWLLLTMACTPDTAEPQFEAEGCEESAAPEAGVEDVSGVLTTPESGARVLSEVTVTVDNWTLTFADGVLTTDSEHCDCTSESFGFARLTAAEDGAESQAVVSGGTVCFRNTSTCGEVELIGAGVLGAVNLQVSGTGPLSCDEG